MPLSSEGIFLYLRENRPSYVAAPSRTKVLSSSLRLAGTIFRKYCYHFY